MYKLLIEDDEGGKTAVSLIRDEITIGRKEGNTIRLTDRNVSRRHGRIVREDDKVFIEDVAARYGIKKNGKRIDERAELQEGDVVLIGDYRLTLRAETKGKKKGADAKSSKKGLPKPKSAPRLDDDFSDNQRETTQIVQAMPAKLVVVSSNFAGEEFPLSHREMVIGRGDDCHIIIDHRSISQKHAKIVREDNTTYKIVDLNSKNGVKVSGDSYRATHLKRGDVVELGHVKFRFVEPGENYVFQPQSQSPDATMSMAIPEAPKSGGMDTQKMGLLLGAVVAVVVVVGVGIMILSGDDTEEVNTGQTEVVAVDDEPIEIDTGSDLDETIEEARARIEDGQLQRTIGWLEGILDARDDISAAQEDEIQDLLRTAQNEIPFQRTYEDALSELGSGDVLAALDEASAIPPHSLFHQRMRDDGTLDQIFDALLELGYSALDEERFDEARELADEILMVDGDYGPATDLLVDIDDAEEQIAIARAERQERREAAVAVRGDSSDPGNRRPTPTPTPSPSLTAEEAAEKYRQAGREFAGGNPREAINICGQALRAGHTPCHRIMGLAYTRLDDTVNACSHFSQYLATNPSNPGPVQNQMDNLGCD